MRQTMEKSLEIEHYGYSWIGAVVYTNLEKLQVRLTKIKNQYRCPNCGSFANLGKSCSCCARGKGQTRFLCLYCGNRNTVKNGKPYGKQQWFCKDCHKCWIQDGVGRGHYERVIFSPRPKRIIKDTTGTCIRCSRPNQILGDFLCYDCSDNLGESMLLYYRRKAQGQCVFCGNPKLSDSIFCSICREKSRKVNRIKMRSKRKFQRSL